MKTVLQKNIGNVRKVGKAVNSAKTNWGRTIQLDLGVCGSPLKKKGLVEKCRSPPGENQSLKRGGSKDGTRACLSLRKSRNRRREECTPQKKTQTQTKQKKKTKK